MKESSKIAKNSFYLYVRLIVSTLINLYVTRLLLISLGTNDYGTYNLVAGVVATLSFLNGAMTVTTQRYISYNLGRGIESEANKVFKTSTRLHLYIGITILFILEIAGNFLFDGFLNLNGSNIEVAKIVYQFSIVTTLFSIIAVPYDSLINAYEHLHFDAILGIIEVLLKLAIASLIYYLNSDRLIFYSGLLMLLTIIIRLAKTIYCKKKFKIVNESKNTKPDKVLFKEMLKYSSWNLFGALCYIASTQGLAIVLNLFKGLTMNASYAVGNQIGTQMLSFSVMATRALNPQIIKSEGKGDRLRMIKLSTFSSKISTSILAIIAIPMLIEISYILKIWLNNVPEYATEFCFIIIINALINQLSVGLKTAVQAVGKIKLYQSVVGSTVLMIIPVSFVILKLGGNSYNVLMASTIIEIISLIIRISIANKIYGLNMKNFLNNIVFKMFLVIISCYAIIKPLSLLIDESFVRLIISSSMSILIYLILNFFYVLNKDERHKIIDLIKPYLVKIGILKPKISS